MTTIATPDADSAARQDLLERYARLAIRVGINLEPGREVAIRAMIEHAPLVRALVRAGYEAGARRVEVDYEDLEVLRSQIALAPEEAVGTAPRWMFERLDDVREQRRAQVFVIGFPPDMFGGLDPARVARSFPAPAALRGAIGKLRESKVRAWTLIACPTPSWAKQVYGEHDPERLWQALAHACRLDETDPVAAWQTHIDNLEAGAALLNEHGFDAVRFRGPGTDLIVGLTAAIALVRLRLEDQARARRTARMGLTRPCPQLRHADEAELLPTLRVERPPADQHRMGVGKRRAAVHARDRVCVRCGSTERLEVHHREPVVHGGSNELEELELLCARCHRLA